MRIEEDRVEWKKTAESGGGQRRVWECNLEIDEDRVGSEGIQRRVAEDSGECGSAT